MRAGVHDRYGPPDVLRIEDVQRIPAGMSKMGAGHPRGKVVVTLADA
jgi:hypothetical protein